MAHHTEICAMIQEARKKLDSCMHKTDLKSAITEAKAISKRYRVKHHLFVCPPNQFIKFINSK